MRALVIDASSALGFLMANEQAPAAMKALEALERGVPTWVPGHWALEVSNGLLTAQRRHRLTAADVADAVDVLQQLPIETDTETSRRSFGVIAEVARLHNLTVYDAAYLELAMRKGAALATSDATLARARVLRYEMCPRLRATSASLPAPARAFRAWSS
jgi:predicted nucleic acid-binding protein